MEACRLRQFCRRSLARGCVTTVPRVAGLIHLPWGKATGRHRSSRDGIRYKLICLSSHLHVDVSSAVAKSLACGDRKFIHAFGTGSDVASVPDDAQYNSVQLLGGKGNNLCEMSATGLNVPPGFILTTELCAQYHEEGRKISDKVWNDIRDALRRVEELHGARLGDTVDPLLVSVRCGAQVQTPGLMDTVLNLGLNDEITEILASKAGERFAWDSYRRFIAMFGISVMGLDSSIFQEKLEHVKDSADVIDDVDLSVAHLKKVVRKFKCVYHLHDLIFPENPEIQLQLAVHAAFNSWESENAVLYRKVNHTSDLAGTAVTVQAMVFGNLGQTSGTGVCFTRNPSTGQKSLYGGMFHDQIEYLEKDLTACLPPPKP